MAGCAAAAVIGARFGVLLWCWIALQFAYWGVIFIGFRRYRGASPGSKSADGAASVAYELVTPAYNEASHLPLIARMLDDAREAGIEATVIDDGSRDRSADALTGVCHRSGARLLRHKVNRGKAAALQSGVEAARAPYLLTLDADTTIAFPVQCGARVEPLIGAVAFTIVAVESGRPLAAMQAAEYAYVLNFERMALAGFGLVLTVPGAASLWRVEALHGIGGFSSRTCAEDTDATIALQLAGWRVAVADNVVAATECPSTFRALIRQRARWIWGNLHVACYAALDCMRGRALVRQTAAFVMIGASAMNLTGYAIATAMLFRLVMLDLGRSDLVASAVLCLATIGRILVTRWLQEMPDRGLVATMAALLSMQAMNFAGFWYGALGRVGGHREW
jgi:cellulose synthase/poly-beta-1,6-N-acetylglucosamine synthase-like glycosyltransferase